MRAVLSGRQRRAAGRALDASLTRQQRGEKRINAEQWRRLIGSIIFKRGWTQVWTQTPRYGIK
jgi:hypothetical protein